MIVNIFYYDQNQRSVDMDTNFVNTGVHVHVTDMDVDMVMNMNFSIKRGHGHGYGHVHGKYECWWKRWFICGIILLSYIFDKFSSNIFDKTNLKSVIVNLKT